MIFIILIEKTIIIIDLYGIIMVKGFFEWLDL
jgi:hypothetical protein